MAKFYKTHPGLIEIVTREINEVTPDGETKLVQNVAAQKPKLIGCIQDTPLHGEAVKTYSNATQAEIEAAMHSEELILVSRKKLNNLRNLLLEAATIAVTDSEAAPYEQAIESLEELLR